MNSNYSTFNYNEDFTPTHSIFNVNTTNKRYVGIGTHNPNEFLDIIGNISTTNLFINKTLFYNNNTTNNSTNTNTNNNASNTNNIHVLQVDSTQHIITPNLVSSNYEETGTEWSIVNNNNIKLTLRNINDNTRFHYQSSIFQTGTVENTASFTIYLNSTVTMKYLYILKYDINQNQINNTHYDNINTLEITINNITTSLENSINNDGLFKFTNFITLSKNSYTVTLKKTSTYNNLNIQFLGTYDYYAGSLWNKDSSSVTFLNNVGIGTNIPTNNLEVAGNSVFTGNLTVNNKLTSSILNTSHLTVNGYASINNIEPYSNNLIINPHKTPIGIASTQANDFLDIGSTFKIRSNGHIIFNNLNITNNINFTQNKSFVYNNSSITLNTSNNIIYKLNNKTILNDNSNSINLYSKLSINDASNASNASNVSNNSDMLYVNGNVNILGNLTTNINQPFIYNPISTKLHNSLNTSHTTVNDLLHCDGFLYTDTLESTSIDIKKHFNLPTQNNDIALFSFPYIYYNKVSKKYMIFNGDNSKAINTTISLLDFSNVTKLISNNASQINFIHCNDITTNILENNKTLDINSSQIFYNVNSNKEEILIDNNPYYFDCF